MRAIKATACALIAIALNESSGDVIFDTYGNPEHTFDTTSGALVAWIYSPGFVTGTKKAVLFTAPSGTDWLLESVELPIKYADSLNLRFSIIQGSGNIPTGTTIWTTANPPGLYTGTDTFQIATIPASGLLTEGSSYWFVLEPDLTPYDESTNGFAGWAWTSPSNSVMLSRDSHDTFPAGGWYGWSEATEFQAPAISITASAIPEPSSIMLLATAMTFLWMARRMAKKR